MPAWGSKRLKIYGSMFRVYVDKDPLPSTLDRVKVNKVEVCE